MAHDHFNCAHIIYSLEKSQTGVFNYVVTCLSNVFKSFRITLVAIPDEDKVRTPDGMILINFIFLLLFGKSLNKQIFYSFFKHNASLLCVCSFSMLSRKYSDGTSDRALTKFKNDFGIYYFLVSLEVLSIYNDTNHLIGKCRVRIGALGLSLFEMCFNKVVRS